MKYPPQAKDRKRVQDKKMCQPPKPLLHMQTPTQKQREGLMWIYERQPIGWFDNSGPTGRMRSALQLRGWIRRIPQLEAVSVIKWEVTTRGIEALKRM